MLVVLVGNIGTGKSHFISKLNKRNNRRVICPDDMLEEHGSEREVHNVMLRMLDKYLGLGFTVIVDGNNLDRRSRDMLCHFAKRNGVNSVILDFGPGTEASLQRRVQSSPEFTEEEWREIHESNIAGYEEPNDDEHFDRVIKKH